MMNILITGKNGFIAKNLLETLSGQHNVMSISHNESEECLYRCCSKCDVIYHLAAVQRSENEEDFVNGNIIYTKKIIKAIEKSKNHVPVIFSSSTGIENNNIFAKTKLEAEKILREYGKKYEKNIVVFKLNNIYGKYGKPDFNNVIATFCNNVARSRPILIHNPATILKLTYIDDLMKDFVYILNDIDNYNDRYDEYILPSNIIEKTLGDIVKTIGDVCNGKVYDEFSERIQKTLMSYYK